MEIYLVVSEFLLGMGIESSLPNVFSYFISENKGSQMPKKYPSIKSIVFFHYSSDKTTTDKAVNWYFKDDLPAREAIIKQVSLWPDSVRLAQVPKP